MMLARVSRLFLLGACFVFPTAAAAQIGDPIVELRLDQEGQPVDDPVLMALVETTVGEPLSMRDVRETTTHFMSLNRFEDVRSFVEPVAGGVRLRYELIPLHPVDRLEFRGTLGLSADTLREVVTERFGAAPGAARATEVAEAVKAAYRQRGYPLASVTPRVIESHGPDRATMELDIDAGRRAVIAGVMMVQTDQREADVAIGLPTIRQGEPYDQQRVDAILQAWTDRMRDRGYYAARASHGVLFPDDAYVTVNIARGPRVVIAFAGDPLPASERERLVPVREEASADEDLLEDAARNIEAYFFARGYRDAAVEYTQVEKDGELVITFDVSRGPRFVVDAVSFTGNTALTTGQLQEMLRLNRGALFVDAVLENAVAEMRNQYRVRGFTRASITPTQAVLPPLDAASPDRSVDVRIAIDEGPRTLLRSVAFTGNTALTEAQLRAASMLMPGNAYSDADVVTAREIIELEYRNRGYESVVVTPDAARAENDTQADVTFRLVEGPQSIVDHIIILGNERTSMTTITRELLLREGEPLGYAALIESRAQLMALGLFSGVQIEPVAQTAQGGRRDVIVRVQEAPANSFGFGGGLEGQSRLRIGDDDRAEERFELAPRGFIEIGRRNLWGKNRSVNLFTRVSLRSRQIAVADDGITVVAGESNALGFNEYRVIGTFREPRAFGTSAELLVTNIFEQAARSSFNFSRRIIRAETGAALTRGFSAAGRYSFERTKLFDEVFGEDQQPLIDRLFPQVRLSKVAGSLIHDSRDDLADTSNGQLVIVDGDLAARAIGSEVGFIKTYIQGFSFHRLPTTRRMVAAFAARVGAAHGFTREVEELDANGQPVTRTVQDLPASERFFAGGDTSVRGFSLDRLGNDQTITQSGFPTGGNVVIVLSAELRVTTLSPLQVVGFLDAGNVFLRAEDLDFTDLRPAAGAGLRYRSPVGPLRFDLGFNLDRRELVPGKLERRTVFHISLGQAF